MMQRILVTAVVLGTVFAVGCTHEATTTDPSSDIEDGTTPQNPSEEAIEQLNQRRLESGLSVVSIDPALEAGCAAHVQYMESTGTVIHQQDPNSPFFTVEGATAAENATLTANVSSLSGAVDAWLSEPYHRRPLLHPGLSVVGGAFSNGFACLDIFSGATGVKDHAPIPYPGRGAENVPATYKALGTANPLPAGWSPPVGTVISYEIPAHWTLTGTTSVLLQTADNPEPVALWIGLPHRTTDPYASFQGNTILAIPEQPLQPDTKYQCSIDGQTIQQEGGNPGPLTDTWTFTTSP